MRERFRLPPEYQTGFREQFAGSDNGLLAIAVHVGASVFVPQMQPDVLWFAVEVLRRHLYRHLKLFPALENRSLRPMRNGYRRKAFLNPRDDGEIPFHLQWDLLPFENFLYDDTDFRKDRNPRTKAIPRYEMKWCPIAKKQKKPRQR